LRSAKAFVWRDVPTTDRGTAGTAS